MWSMWLVTWHIFHRKPNSCQNPIFISYMWQVWGYLSYGTNIMNLRRENIDWFWMWNNSYCKSHVTNSVALFFGCHGYVNFPVLRDLYDLLIDPLHVTPRYRGVYSEKIKREELQMKRKWNNKTFYRKTEKRISQGTVIASSFLSPPGKTKTYVRGRVRYIQRSLCANILFCQKWYNFRRGNVSSWSQIGAQILNSTNAGIDNFFLQLPRITKHFVIKRTRWMKAQATDSFSTFVKKKILKVENSET